MAALEIATPRPTLSNRAAYRLAGGVIGLGLFASITPTPLYGTYSELWHFSPLTLTLIYATYAFGVLATLLLAGGVSDQVGRRPVLLVALAGLMGASLLYLFADSAAWLFAARGLQGLATGAALSAASASLLDLHPAVTRPASLWRTRPRRQQDWGSACSSPHRSCRSAGTRACCPTSCCSL